MRLFLLTITLFLLTACSPKYEIKTHYTPPSDSQGKSCVRSCSNDKRVCQASCNMKYDQCLATAKKGASKAFPSLMNEYQDVLNDYQYAMDRYNREMNSWTREEERADRDFEHYRSTCYQDSPSSYECQRANELGSQLRSLENHQPIAPSRPIKPSLASEIKQAQKNCSNHCGCTKSYDNCFGSCGGKIRYEKICVENCK